MIESITNPVCAACKLYNRSPSPCNVPRSNTDSQVDVYVVANGVNPWENGVMTDDAGRWVTDMLDAMGYRYVLDSVTRCASDTANVNHRKSCRQLVLADIAKYQPKVILCLGLDSAQHVTAMRLSLTALTKAGIVEGPNGTPTVVVDHPHNHSSFKNSKRDGRDLRPDYKRAFTQIDHILSKGWAPAKLDYDVLSTCEDSLKFLDDNAFELTVFSWDTEFGLQPDRNISHKSCELLNTGAGWFDGNQYRVVVFDLVDMDRAQKYKVLQGLLHHSTVVSTFTKIDMQSAFFMADYNCWVDNGIKSFYDTGQIRWLQDQERKGNGLEDVAVELIGATPWKYKTDAALAKIKEERTLPLAEGLTDYDYRHLDRDFRNEYQAWDLYWQARVWWEHFADPDNPTRLRAEYDIDAWRRTQKFTKFLCLCEQTGLIVDLDYLGRYKDVCQKKLEYVGNYLNNVPLIKRLQKTPDPSKPSGPILDEEGNPSFYKSGPRKGLMKEHPLVTLLPEEGFNPGSTVHMSNIVKHLGITTVDVTKVTQQPKVDARELAIQSTPAPGEPKTGRHHFFEAVRIWRQQQKQIGSFIEPFIHYAVPARRDCKGYEEGQHRVHPMFKMIKLADVSGTDSVLSGGVDSGRVSSTDPCGTNIDKKPVFRRSFPAPPGYLVWEEDQASVEPRVLAYDSGCQSWIDLFELRHHEPENPDADIYLVEWAKFERNQGRKWIQAGDVTKEQRKTSKPLVLGAMYEATAYGVHLREQVPLDICERFMKAFWEGVPEIQAYNAELRRKAFEGEMIVSSSGARCRFEFHNPYDYDHDKHKHLPLSELQKAIGMPEEDAHICRKLENFVTQRTAKDITDVSAIELMAYAEKEQLRYILFNNTVHDSIWGYIREESLEDWYHIVMRIAPDVGNLKKHGIVFKGVPMERARLAVEVSAGPHWGAVAPVHFAPRPRIRGLSL